MSSQTLSPKNTISVASLTSGLSVTLTRPECTDSSQAGFSKPGTNGGTQA